MKNNDQHWNYWGKRYVSLIRRDYPYTLNCKEDDQCDLIACKDLIEEGFMKGNTSLGPVSPGGYNLLEVDVLEVTIKGYLFADDQAKIIKENSFLGRLNKYLGFILGWLFTIITAVIIHYLTK